MLCSTVSDSEMAVPFVVWARNSMSDPLKYSSQDLPVASATTGSEILQLSTAGRLQNATTIMEMCEISNAFPAAPIFAG